MFSLIQPTLVPNGGNFYGNIPAWHHFNIAVDAVNLNFVVTAPDGTVTTVALAAGLTQDVVLCQLPANAFCHAVREKTVVPFAGATTMTAKVGVAGADTLYYSTAFDLTTAVSATGFAPATTAGSTVGCNTTAPINLVVLITTTVADINALTAGSVDVWVLLSVLDATVGK